jgi:hypothetical protein
MIWFFSKSWQLSPPAFYYGIDNKKLSSSPEIRALICSLESCTVLL